MDEHTLMKLGAVGFSLAAGAFTKHKTKLNHKAVGPAQNAVIGAAVAGLPGMDAVDGFTVWATSETIYNGAKGVVHGVRSLVDLFRKIF